MTEMKSRSWMDGWSDDDFAEYSQAWHAATSVSDDSGERSREWLRLILGAEQAHRSWAGDVLADMQRRGALESWKAAPVVPVVKNKRGKMLTTRAAAKRRADDGEGVEFVQESLFNMTDDELQEVEALAWAMSSTHRDKALLVERLRALIAQAVAAGATRDGITAHAAAALLHVDLTEWCAA